MTYNTLAVLRSPLAVGRSPSAVYFIGIGGIGMSALARYYKHAGAQVAGYDRTPSPLTAELEREGVDIHYSDDVALIPPAFTASPDNTLVIYTPAVPAEHSELSYFTNNNYTLIKRSKALGHIAATKTTLAVAGTHGKTTITTMLAHLLTQAAGGCTAFLGGISKNYHSNLLLSDKPALVAEADEFDRSFLQLFPQIAVITATDADHLDIYGTAGEVKKAFADFARQVKPGGALIIKEGVELSLAGGGTGTAGVDSPPPACGHPLQEGDNPFPVPRSPFTVYRYSANRPCDFYADNIRLMDNGLPQFDLHLLGTVLPDCVLGIPGRMNVENAVAATAAAYLYFVDKPLGDVDKLLGDVDKPSGDVDKPSGDVDKPSGDVDKPSGDVDKPSGDVDKPSGDVDKPSGDVDKPLGDVDKPLGDVDKPLGDVNQNHSVLSALRSALAAFSGVQRRFDIQFNTPGCTYIDDYAHHPEELRAAITSLRETYPHRKITGIFQPHLYSRTRDFADDFAKSLDLLDRLILLDIYPAREEPLPGVTSQLIFDRMALKNKTLCRKDELMALLEKEPVDVLATFGAGDIDRFVESITALLHRRNHETK